MEENNNHPSLYTEKELSEIQDIIKYYMNHIDQTKFVETDDDIIRGCKITAFIANHAKQNNHDEKIVSAYIKYPPFMYYTDPEYYAIRRIYGMGIREDTTVVAHVVTAMSVVNNDVIGGVELDQCIHVKDWSVRQKNFLNSGRVQGSECFTNPLGFTNFLDD